MIYHGIKDIQIQEFLDNPNIGEEGIKDGFEYFKINLDAGKITTKGPSKQRYIKDHRIFHN